MRQPPLLCIHLLAGLALSASPVSTTFGQSSFQFIPTPIDYPSASALAISGDGSTIGGQAEVSPTLAAQAWWWRAGSPASIISGGTLMDLSRGMGISYNGDVITATKVQHHGSFRLSPSTGITQTFPPIGQSIAEYSTVSAYGRTIVGSALDSTGRRRASITHLDAAVCYANCDNSSLPPILNANDFQCFLNRCAAGEPYGNCDGSVTPASITINDFLCFMNAFADGCP